MTPPRKTRDDKLGLPDDYNLDASIKAEQNVDDDLGRRLRALRAGTRPGGVGAKAGEAELELRRQEQDELIARFAGLRGVRENSELDLPVSPSRPFSQEEMESLMKEVQTEVESSLKTSQDNEGELTDEQLAAIMDEAKALPSPPDSEDEGVQLPDVPSEQPEDDLSLPSAPSSVPLIKPKAVAKTKAPTNDEIDSWCSICNDDAVLECLGCDREKYCLECWNEGHTGPDAGYEERRHKAKLLVGKEDSHDGKKALLQ